MNNDNWLTYNERRNSPTQEDLADGIRYKAQLENIEATDHSEQTTIITVSTEGMTGQQIDQWIEANCNESDVIEF